MPAVFWRIMEFSVKRFSDLTTEELFEIYKLRISVFVVEQKCPYQDVDNVDRVSIHVLMKENNEIIGYLRVIPAGVTYANVSIGRVISVNRGLGNGTVLLKKGIETAIKYFNAQIIEIGAQVYAQKLYKNCGFIPVSDIYLEDGIPHINMVLNI